MGSAFKAIPRALPRGESDFRLAIDRALSRIYRLGEIATVFARSFGPRMQPSDTLKTLCLISASPEQGGASP